MGSPGYLLGVVERPRKIRSKRMKKMRPWVIKKHMMKRAELPDGSSRPELPGNWTLAAATKNRRQ